MESWRKFLNERAYAFGTTSLPSGNPGSLCPQGMDQIGWKDVNEPKCRPKPELKQNGSMTIKGVDKLVEYIFNHPNQTIKVEYKPGHKRSFAGSKRHTLPFYYGEWPYITNPADGMGWDFVMVPSSDINENNLLPIGHVAYNQGRPTAIGNDKVIIAPDGKYGEQDRQLIVEFFRKFDFFNEPEWY